MMLLSILAVFMSSALGFEQPDVTSDQQKVEAWSTLTDVYGPCYDVRSRQWLLTADVAGKPTILRTPDLKTPPKPMQILGGPVASVLGCITMSQAGDAYGVTYEMRRRQTFASIVRVYVGNDMIRIGDPILVSDAESFASYPTISPDGDLMIFATDRSGGTGGTDLWFMERQLDGSWSKPQQCSESMNSPYNETSPHLLSNDSLLFSSNGFGGQGGMDVFLTVFHNGVWQDPVPLEALNTPGDDTDAVRTPAGDLIVARKDNELPGNTRVWVVKSLLVSE